MKQQQTETESCKKTIQAIQDTMYVVGGKWKISIITSLCYSPKRYSEILKDIERISGKMLSRELKEMEANKLITRTVLSTHPIAVQYELTDYSQQLMPVIYKLAEWGINHRRELFGK